MTEHLYADTVVIGGGTAGAAVAARLAQGGSQSVLLMESGADYGAYAEGRWPAQLLDARSLPGGHDWGYVNNASTGRPGHLLERARVIGGCSSHNGCAAIWGSRVDYDGWAALGNAGWSAASGAIPVSGGAGRGAMSAASVSSAISNPLPVPDPGVEDRQQHI
jgi:choline dehydrogenase